jgi:hypothetical protein
MPSPFPGMDPFLEEPGGWAGVHDALIAIMRELLNRDLGPGYIADGGTSVYILSPEERRWVYPDVLGTETRAPLLSAPGRGGIAAPIRVRLEASEPFEQPHIIIRDRAGRHVVAVIELLSPINKRPLPSVVPPASAREEYLHERRETMASPTHWVEIDLLRAGERPPEARGAGDYYALSHRAGAGEAEIWAWDLREPLPTIGIPLAQPEAEVALDLQEALALLFERYRYAEVLDYHRAPPPCSLADTLWIAERVRAWEEATGAGA